MTQSHFILKPLIIYVVNVTKEQAIMTNPCMRYEIKRKKKKKINDDLNILIYMFVLYA